MGLSKQNIELFLEPLKIKRRKIAVESDWDSKNSQNQQTLGFSKNNRWLFQEEVMIFFINL